jgi:hypothetical protein
VTGVQTCALPIYDGIRTGDIMAAGCTLVSTEDMGNALIKELSKLKAKAA